MQVFTVEMNGSKLQCEPPLNYFIDLRIQYGTGSVKIWNTRHKLSVRRMDIFTVYAC